jgi:hypothetical protein
MREELPRFLAFLFLASAIGLLEIAAARALARAIREAREDWRVWRFRRQVRAYEAERLDDRVRRGDR